MSVDARLYKFIGKPDDVEFVLRGSVKFTPIPELNDPSELLPNVIPEDVKVSLKRLRKVGYRDEDMVHLRQQGKLLQRLAPNFQAIRVPQTKEEATTLIRSKLYDNLPLLEHLLERTAEQISSQVGFFCLTERNDALPMWAHYAGNATGLVVKFRDLRKIFRGDNTGILRQPIPIRYERERLGVTFDPETHASLFFAKFQDWSYEQEARGPAAHRLPAGNGRWHATPSVRHSPAAHRPAHPGLAHGGCGRRSGHQSCSVYQS